MFSRKFKILPALLAFALVSGYGCDNDDDDDNNPPAPAGSDSQVNTGLTLTGAVVADQRFSTLKTALEKADLVKVLDQGEYTVFAPTNDAFAKIPAATLNALLNDKAALTQVLLYHVVLGSLKADQVLAAKELKSANDFEIFLKPSSIVTTDILTKNGVIHAIDTVLTPPTVVDLVTNDPRFTTLKTAVVAAGLVDTLKAGNFTIFAPTNEAFAKLGAGTLTAVLADKAKLTSILLFHVVPGTVKAADVLASPSLATANQGLLTPELRDGAAYINGAKILETDVLATDGVIHAIDTVLLPPAK